MQVQIELWELIGGVASCVAAFAAVVWAFGTILVSQFKDSLDARFVAQDEMREQRDSAQDEMRKEREKAMDERFSAIDRSIRQEAEGWRAVERDFLKFQRDMPLEYVRREDYIRGQTVIESKLDAVYSKLELVRIQGAQPAGSKT